MYILIIVAMVVLIYVIRKLISDGIDNAVNSISAHIRNKKYQNQAPQNLADRYANAQQPQNQQPQDQDHGPSQG